MPIIAIDKERLERLEAKVDVLLKLCEGLYVGKFGKTPELKDILHGLPLDCQKLPIEGDRFLIEKQARMQIKQVVESDDWVSSVFWFPHDREVRFLLVSSLASRISPDVKLKPFLSKPSSEDGLIADHSSAFIHPDEVGKAKLPDSWCSWDEAVELY